MPLRNLKINSLNSATSYPPRRVAFGSASRNCIPHSNFDLISLMHFAALWLGPTILWILIFHQTDAHNIFHRKPHAQFARGPLFGRNAIFDGITRICVGVWRVHMECVYLVWSKWMPGLYYAVWYNHFDEGFWLFCGIRVGSNPEKFITYP